MTDGIAAITARIAELRTRLGQAAPAASTSASGAAFAAKLESARAATSAAPATAPASTTHAHESSPVTGRSKLTGRMRGLINEVDQRFGPFPTIGGWRSDGGIAGGGEHPLGRAADFMLSSGGAMPSAAQRAKGREIAEWITDNADRLGVKYVIYDQKIWNPSRAAEGWRPMENRGSVTQNHYDHIHVSVN
ncbi:hypothetical protein [Spirillospora albida]|uniref:hypothetical protein n=1 Tax=Spirillospora albida TaxID=58123 RepID=UPI0006925C26|nr:hypothetical protein [Spirillospora albida]